MPRRTVQNTFSRLLAALARGLAIVLAISLSPSACAPARVGTAPRHAPPELGPSDRLMRVHFIDVGQGDATLFEFPCAAVLIDTGAEKNELFDGTKALEDYLNAFFRRRHDLNRTLALLVITHPHMDHVLGLGRLLAPGAGIRIQNVLTNGQETSPGGAEQRRLHAWVRSSPGVRYREIVLDQVPIGEGLTDEIIDPVKCKDVDPSLLALWGRVREDPGWGRDRWGKHFEDENNHSIVLRVDFGQSSVLALGDLEEPAQLGLLVRNRGSKILDVDLYRAAHHGSDNATRSDFLRVVSPKIAIISMGPSSRHTDWSAWRYGHPRRYAVEKIIESVSLEREPVTVTAAVAPRRFEELSLHRSVYATGWDGTVVLEASLDGHYRVITAGRD